MFGRHDVDAALDLLHLADMAWHDSYPGDLELDPAVLSDILSLAHGDLATLINVTRAAVIDVRDVRSAAAALKAVQRV